VSLELILWALILALIFSAVAQGVIQTTYNRYATLRASTGVSARVLARQLLDEAGLKHVTVAVTEKLLDDRYDPRARVLHTSNPNATSVSALAVTAHEVGHALQHHQRYWALRLRQVLQPAGHWMASSSLVAIFVGWFLRNDAVTLWGGGLYLGALLLMLCSLPVELDANRRALALLQQARAITERDERRAAQRVLGAAVLTYVGAALSPAIHGLLLFWSRRQR